MSAFDLGPGFERAVIRLSMLDGAFLSRASKLVEAGHFTSPERAWLWSAVLDYWGEYGLPPTDLPLHRAASTQSLDKAPGYLSELERVLERGRVVEGPWVRGEVEEFCRRQIFAVAHRRSAELFNSADHRAAYEVMARAQDEIRDVQFDAKDRQFLFEEFPERQHRRHMALLRESDDVVSTGIPELDNVTDGGVHPGELWSVFAYAKRCKTTWLINQGFHAVRMAGMCVLHVVLEGRGSMIADRYDACFSGDVYASVRRGEFDPAKLRDLHDEYRRCRRLMVVRTINDWDVTAADVRAELLEVRALGYDPRLLIVDYMDLLRSRDRVSSETQHQVNAARDLTRLVMQEEVAGWSAWQATRPKEGAHDREHVLTSASVADCYAKVRIVEAFGSLNATRAEMREGKMRLYMEEHRDKPLDLRFLIRNDLGRMRMATKSELMKKKEAPVVDPKAAREEKAKASS